MLGNFKSISRIAGNISMDIVNTVIPTQTEINEYS
jgi:hypothetical protein